MAFSGGCATQIPNLMFYKCVQKLGDLTYLNVWVFLAYIAEHLITLDQDWDFTPIKRSKILVKNV